MIFFSGGFLLSYSLKFFVFSDLAAVAYHLALQGLGSEVVLLEQNRLVSISFEKMTHFYQFYRLNYLHIFRIGGGMTWHSSGLVGAFKPTYSQVLLAQQTIKLYEDLTSKGLKTGWKQCGSLNVARTRDRMTQFRRMKALSVWVLNYFFSLHVIQPFLDSLFDQLIHFQFVGH